MGIRGLNTCILKTAPESIKTVNWQTFENKQVGIDITCFLYRAIASRLAPIDIIAAQVANFKQLKITPFYVFDGKPPSEKDGVVTKRRADRNDALEICKKLKAELANTTDEIIREKLSFKIREIEEKNPVLTHEIKDEIKRFLYATGTQFVTATSESDSLLAYMFKRSMIDAVVSLDLDFIARSTLLLVPKNIETNVGETWYLYDPVKIRRALRLSETKFVQFCVLIGSDYTPELTIVPWKTALISLLANQSVQDIWSRHTFSNWRRSDSQIGLFADLESLNRAVDILSGINDTTDTLLSYDQWERCLLSGQIEYDELASMKEKYTYWDSKWWELFTQVL
jgi:flap endonuclease-1